MRPDGREGCARMEGRDAPGWKGGMRPDRREGFEKNIGLFKRLYLS